MTNLAHWQDDIDEALGGDFDGSLSGLCIMSLSFDFTRNGTGSLLGANRDNNLCTNQASNIQQLASTSTNKTHMIENITENLNANPNANQTAISHTNTKNQVENDNSNNCFKRFKSAISSNDCQSEDEGPRNSSQDKTTRHLQQIKNCLTNLTANSTCNNATGQDPEAAQEILDPNRSSPHSTDGSCHRASVLSTIDDSSQSSTIDARSPSPSPSHCTSISMRSQDSSRSQSPSDASVHSEAQTNKTNRTENQNRNKTGVEASAGDGQTNKRSVSNGQKSRSGNSENQQVSLYSVKDSLFTGGTLKESSYTTSVITTTAPMHFKNLHQSFPLRQFPPSPYHQFSNSSLNHDFYDRYMSHDSHQPLQTPLIGIERTQDLLSLRLPPHGPDESDMQRFSRDWAFDEAKNEASQSNRQINKSKSNQTAEQTNEANGSKIKSGTLERSDLGNSEKGFPFNYKSSSSVESNDRIQDQREPIDLNVSYEQDNCCNDDGKDTMFNESMKHFNPDRANQNVSFGLRNKRKSNENQDEDVNHHENLNENASSIAHQYNGQESMFGLDPSKQRFQYVLAAPISVATKVNEDTMTYLNQGQAYEIKLENVTEVAEAKKGFMCSIINIGFHERHMQQSENELWQQWSHQHPNEKIFLVDMKLSYNVFGVESDGLNKYEFLWDSSKAAGVFIRINSISTEFTAKKHGGEKGVPFKLSIETFSYNSKTHESRFISCACCQIKVFKPKGAERKIRSDRDKIQKRPLIEQEKYHKPSDHTVFSDCLITSLHPMVDGSLSDYRHSHGHFASKQFVSSTSAGAFASGQSASHDQASEEMDEVNNNSSQQDHSLDGQQNDRNRSGHENNEEDSSNNVNANNNNNTSNQRDYNNHSMAIRHPNVTSKTHIDCSSRSLQASLYVKSSFEHPDHQDQTFGAAQTNSAGIESSNFTHPNEILQSAPFNQMYHSNTVRNVPSLSGINNSQHFGMAYYSHALPSTLPAHIPQAASYSIGNSGTLPNIAHQGHNTHAFPVPSQQHLSVKGVSSIYRQLNHDKQVALPAPGHATSFKASNLAISSSHTNFQSYLGTNLNNDACNDNHHQNNHSYESKEGSHNNLSYHHEHYEPHGLHSSSSAVQPSRQRSTSASLTISTGHYNTYNAQGRLLEGYSGHSNNLVENPSNTNLWVHQSTGPNNSGSSTNNCSIRGGSNVVGNNGHDDNQIYSIGHMNYEQCNNQHYDSEQNSPIKSNQYTNESSSSCQSKSKNELTNIGCINQRSPTSTSRPLMITVNSDCHEVASWFVANRFVIYSKTFSNFSGSDLLRLSKNDLIEICGLIDGIRLYNSLHNQPIKPRKILYVCYKKTEDFCPVYLYDVSLAELLRELFNLFNCHLDDLSSASLIMDNKHKSPNDKMGPNSGSSSDSRSSNGAQSIDTGNEDNYHQRISFFHDFEQQNRKINFSDHRSQVKSRAKPYNYISKLLIDGLTSVRVLATEQVVQLLEDDSLWELSLSIGVSGSVEACLSSRRSPRNSK